MSRKVRYRVVVGISINESDLALLRLLGDLTLDATGPTALTAKAFSRKLSRSMATVRRSCRVLAMNGLVVVRESHRDDGGRDANTYELTYLGHKLLASEGIVRPRRVQPKKPPESGPEGPSEPLGE